MLHDQQTPFFTFAQADFFGPIRKGIISHRLTHATLCNDCTKLNRIASVMQGRCGRKKRRRQAQYGKSHNPGSSQPLLGNQRIIAFKAPLPGLLRDALP